MDYPRIFKFKDNKTNIEDLLSLEATKPERKQLLEDCKSNDLAHMEGEIARFEPVWNNLSSLYANLENQIGDYGELLKDCELQVCCNFIDRMGTMATKLKNTRHAVTNMDSAIDVLKVKIGEVDVGQAAQDYIK